MLRGLTLLLLCPLVFGGAAHGTERTTRRGPGKVVSGTAGGVIPQSAPARPRTVRARPPVATPTFRLTRGGEIHAGSALRTYNARDKLPNGHVYGESMRNLDLHGMTPSAIDLVLRARGFKRVRTTVRDPSTNLPITSWGRPVPLDIYTHADGGTVRMKPHGVPGFELMAQPNVVKSLRWPHDAPGDGFEHEALKVTNGGDAIPRWPRELRILPGADRNAVITTWAHLAHTDLAPVTTPTRAARRGAAEQSKLP